MLATHLLDTVPSVMREWRKELHSGLPEGLNINQFRVLFFVGLGHDSPSYLARQLGVSAAAMSKMVDVLVNAKLLSRELSTTDRRHQVLKTTREGKAVVKRVRAQVEKRMQSHLDALSSRDQAQISQALGLLQKVFSPTPESSL